MSATTGARPPLRVGIVGAGFAGLAAAYDLARSGHQVTLYDGLEVPGGLAAGFRDEGWDWSIEHFYHHWFTSDDDILRLAREAGLADGLITRRPVTALFHAGRAYALDGVVPVLTFPGMPPADRLRMGLAVAWLRLRRDWRPLERVTARDWLVRWMGPRAYAAVWEPLLIGKFGDRHGEVPMSWMWARLHKRTPRLMYYEGGFQAFADGLLRVVRGLGAEARMGTRVEAIRPAPAGAEGLLTVRAGGRDALYDRVICTTGPHLLARLAPDLPGDYLAGLSDLPYLGAIVAVLALERRLMDDVYWLSMDKRAFPYLAVVEHTNFVDRAHYGDDHLVYVGDYLPPDDPLFERSDQDVLDAWLPSLARINPAFEPGWVRRAWLSRARYAQPVVSRGFSARLPSLETPIDGLLLASMSQVYPWDRGTNYAVEIGRRAAARITGGGGR